MEVNCISENMNRLVEIALKPKGYKIVYSDYGFYKEQPIGSYENAVEYVVLWQSENEEDLVLFWKFFDEHNVEVEERVETCFFKKNEYSAIRHIINTISGVVEKTTYPATHKYLSINYNNLYDSIRFFGICEDRRKKYSKALTEQWTTLKGAIRLTTFADTVLRANSIQTQIQKLHEEVEELQIELSLKHAEGAERSENILNEILKRINLNLHKKNHREFYQNLWDTVEEKGSLTHEDIVNIAVLLDTF